MMANTQECDPATVITSAIAAGAGEPVKIPVANSHDTNGTYVASAIEESGTKSRPSKWRTGRWSLDEKILFLFGLRKFGRGKWKKIRVYVPQRSLVQIKSHAQKVLKRHEQGDNIFFRLEQNADRLKELLANCGDRSGHDSTSLLLPKVSSLTKISLAGKNEAKTHEIDARQHIIAASALCQLAAPAVSSSSASSWDDKTETTSEGLTSGSSSGSLAPSLSVNDPTLNHPNSP